MHSVVVRTALRQGVREYLLVLPYMLPGSALLRVRMGYAE